MKAKMINMVIKYHHRPTNSCGIAQCKTIYLGNFCCALRKNTFDKIPQWGHAIYVQWWFVLKQKATYRPIWPYKENQSLAMMNCQKATKI